MRKPIIIANWKMNKLPKEAEKYIEFVSNNIKKYNNIDVVLAGQDLLLNLMIEASKNRNIAISAENIYWEDKGAYTGETSPMVLSSLGVEYVIIGHSERRNYFRETDEMVNLKVLAALRNNIIPIIAIDEQINVISQDDNMHWIVNQVIESIKGVDDKDIRKIIIAYEPTNMIGSDKEINEKEMQSYLHIIRATLKDKYNEEISESIRIVYGGSVTSKNIFNLLKQKDIDGVLVGNAGLNEEVFINLIKLAWTSKYTNNKYLS